MTTPDLTTTDGIAAGLSPTELASIRQQIRDDYAKAWADKASVDPVAICMNAGHLASHIDALDAEIERLRGIVDRLPKTADGVPVTPGMTVFCVPPKCVQPFCRLLEWVIVLAATDNRGNLIEVSPSAEMYSTREAAEAARSKA